MNHTTMQSDGTPFGLGWSQSHGRPQESWKLKTHLQTRFLSLRNQDSVHCDDDTLVHGVIEESVVSVRGSLYCEGDVVNTVLVVEGNLTIEGTCTGSHIICYGISSLNRIHNSTIFGNGNVLIKRGAINAHVESASNIQAGLATVQGSILSASYSVEAARAEGGTQLHAANPFLRHYTEHAMSDEIGRVRFTLDNIEEILHTLAGTPQSNGRVQSILYHHEQFDIENALRRFYELNNSIGDSCYSGSITIHKHADDSTTATLLGIECGIEFPNSGFQCLHSHLHNTTTHHNYT